MWLCVGLMWVWDAQHNDTAIRMIMVVGFVSLIVENEMNSFMHAFMSIWWMKKSIVVRK
jgi:hypothetical protein